MGEMIDNGLQNTTQKTTDWAAPTSLRARRELPRSETVSSTCSTGDAKSCLTPVNKYINQDLSTKQFGLNTNQ
jgi:hypothetical protein